MTSICPSCKSDRCGNHAACERKHAANRKANTKVLFDVISSLVHDLGVKRGRPLLPNEAEKVAEDFMRDIDARLRAEGHIK